MGTISSGVGLISGIDYGSLIDKLMQIESLPVTNLQTRISKIQAQKTALADISARLSSLLTRISSLSKKSFFQGTAASSSDTNILSAATTSNAAPGSYSFTVRSLAQTQQLISRGFTSRTAPVSAGMLTIESAAARVNSETTLEELNGYSGVQRGQFQIVDGEGKTATIDLQGAQTVSDVLDLINDAGIGVQAELKGEGIRIEDTTGGAAGLRIREMDDGHAAADLGFSADNTYSADGELTGGNLIYLSDATPLTALNDGLGLRRAAAGTDFIIQAGLESAVDVQLGDVITSDTRLERLNHGRGVELGTVRVTNKAGEWADIDLSSAKTVGDVVAAFKNADKDVAVTMAGSKLLITDSSKGEEGDLTIEDVSGHAARDLGIEGTSETTSIRGTQILSVETLGDLLTAINYAAGNQTADGQQAVRAAIDAEGHGIVLTSTTGATLTLATPEGSSSKALLDLGLAPNASGTSLSGSRIGGGLDTVLLKTLNGGRGVVGGTINISANGSAATLDLSGAETLRDVVDAINAASEENELGIEAGYDSTGTRLQISSTTEGGGAIAISDVEGTLAQSLGIDANSSRIKGDDLERQYISESTLLRDLNLGRGVSLGTIKITNSRGVGVTVNLASARVETMQDVIDEIKAAGVPLDARINDSGDGLLITDLSDGTGKLKIEDDTGTAARDLGILGESEGETRQIDGSFELVIDTATADTLDQVVDRINNTKMATASIISDGSSVSPYRLNITSAASGRAGELIIDGGTTGLDLTTLTAAQDASLTFGGQDSGLLLTSSSNTVADAVPGMTLTLTSASDDPVTVTVNRDVDGIASTIQGLVDDYNDLLGRIDSYDSYNVDTQAKGVLFGENVLDTITSRLNSAFTSTVSGVGSQYSRLSQVGITVGSGGKLSFDEDKFRTAYAADEDGVIQFFTGNDNGLAVKLNDILKKMTDTDGLMDRRNEAISEQEEALNTRVSELNVLLEAKREQLYKSYQQMEEALSQMQSQSSSISNLGDWISSMYKSK